MIFDRYNHALLKRAIICSLKIYSVAVWVFFPDTNLRLPKFLFKYDLECMVYWLRRFKIWPHLTLQVAALLFTDLESFRIRTNILDFTAVWNFANFENFWEFCKVWKVVIPIVILEKRCSTSFNLEKQNFFSEKSWYDTFFAYAWPLWVPLMKFGEKIFGKSSLIFSCFYSKEEKAFFPKHTEITGSKLTPLNPSSWLAV